MSSVYIIVYQHKCKLYSKSNIEFTLYSFSSPIIELRDTGSQCTVTSVLSMLDTLRFRGAVMGPGKKQRLSFCISEHTER